MRASLGHRSTLVKENRRLRRRSKELSVRLKFCVKTSCFKKRVVPSR